MRIRLLTPAAAVLFLLGACSDQTPVADDGPTRGADRDTETPGEPSDNPTDSPTSEGNGSGATVPAYFVGRHRSRRPAALPGVPARRR